jgi:hypothetical protein
VNFAPFIMHPPSRIFPYSLSLASRSRMDLSSIRGNAASICVFYGQKRWYFRSDPPLAASWSRTNRPYWSQNTRVLLGYILRKRHILYDHDTQDMEERGAVSCKRLSPHPRSRGLLCFVSSFSHSDCEPSNFGPSACVSFRFFYRPSVAGTRGASTGTSTMQFGLY